MRRLFITFLFVPFISIAQKKQVTLEDIYKNKTFQDEVVPGFSEEPLDSTINLDDVKDENGNQISTKDYELSEDKKRIIFFTGRESIYRRSSKANAYLFDIASKKTTRLNDGKIMHASFSPHGNKIAFVRDNNLYVYDIPTGQTMAITTDGKWNYIINGNCDWVYEEEFGFTQAYQWSPDGNYIAYYRFDESNVKEYEFTVV